MRQEWWKCGQLGHYCREWPRTEVEQEFHITSPSSPSQGPGEIYSLPVRGHAAIYPSAPVEINYRGKKYRLKAAVRDRNRLAQVQLVSGASCRVVLTTN